MRLSVPEAASALDSDGVVACPTETFFALAGLPRSRKAVERLVFLKSRMDGAGISLIVDSAERVEELIGDELPAVAKQRRRLQSAFWPGALTLVIQAGAEVRASFHPEILGPGNTLAIRVSSHPVASLLAQEVGGAFTATSANRKGDAPPVTAEQVALYFPQLPIIEGDSGLRAFPGAGNSQASTILDVTELPFLVLRAGSVAAESLRQVAPVELSVSQGKPQNLAGSRRGNHK